eukprot:1238139-Rhodomonas_salina.1
MPVGWIEIGSLVPPALHLYTAAGARGSRHSPRSNKKNARITLGWNIRQELKCIPCSLRVSKSGVERVNFKKRPTLMDSDHEAVQPVVGRIIAIGLNPWENELGKFVELVGETVKEVHLVQFHVVLEIGLGRDRSGDIVNHTHAKAGGGAARTTDPVAKITRRTFTHR